MPVPSAISELSQTAGSNYPTGAESPITTDDYFRAHASFIAGLRDGKGFTDPITLASATTTSIGAQNSLFVEITGTTTITSFGTTYEGPRFLRFTGALTLTHNATTLNLPMAVNHVTQAGDTCIAIPNSTPNGWNIIQYQRANGVINEARGTIAMHATTMDIWAQPNIIDGTGSAVTITAIANAPQPGARRTLYPVAGTVITNGATFAVDGAANYTTAAGDSLEFEAVTTSTYKVHIVKNDGTPIIGGGTLDTTRLDVASATTVDLTSTAPNTRNINITGTTAITAFTLVVGKTYLVRFAASLTLTNNASIVTQSGANIITQAGDTCILRATAANVVEVLSYVPAMLNQQSARSMVRVHTANGYGSTNTAIRRFTTVVKNQGTDITYADSATLGGSFTINAAGVYAVGFTENPGGAATSGISLNSTQLSTSIVAITTADRLASNTAATNGYDAYCGCTIVLNAGDVIRAHTDAAISGSAARSNFTITRIA